MDDKTLYSGLIRLHMLHHAAEDPLYGTWIADELTRHGYKLSAGTLYPISHGLASKGYLRSHLERDGKSSRRMYRITPLGRKALRTARHRVRELFGGRLCDHRPGHVVAALYERRSAAEDKESRATSYEPVILNPDAVHRGEGRP
jgi:DNA-binding PadR family transcriptional regulator